MKNIILSLVIMLIVLLFSCATVKVPQQPEDLRGESLGQRQMALDKYSLSPNMGTLRQQWMSGAFDVADPAQLAALLSPLPEAAKNYRQGKSTRTAGTIVGIAAAALGAVVGFIGVGSQSNELFILGLGTIAAGGLTGGLIQLGGDGKIKKSAEIFNGTLAATYDLPAPIGSTPQVAILKNPREVVPIPDPTPVAALAAAPDQVSPRAVAGKADAKFMSDVDTIRPGKSPRAADSIAVVIGNKDYRRGTNPVEYALRDANTIRDLFVTGFGLDPNDVWLYENAGLADFISIFGTSDNVRKSRIFRSASLRENQPDLYIYYSGHGAPSTSGETRGKGYLVPVDADLLAIANTGYAIDDVVANVNAMKSAGIIKNAWLVFDACFSGQSGDGSQLMKNVSGLSIKPVAPAGVQPGVSMMFAASGEEFASWYPEKQHGLFTYFLLKGLSGAADDNKDARISLPEMDSYLKKQVPRFANGLNAQEQTPQLLYSPGAADFLVLK